MQTRRDLLKALLLSPLAFVAGKLGLEESWKHVLVPPPKRWVDSLGPMRSYDGVLYHNGDEFLHEAGEVLACDCDWSEPLYYDEEGNPVYSTGWITIPRMGEGTG
jgi:hypothetical protein